MNLPCKPTAAGLVAAAALLVTGALLLADGPAAKVVAPVPEKEPAALDKSRFLALDEFDGQFALNWKPVRPDEPLVSLKKHPGKLTITTQKGTIHGQTELTNPKIAAKNIYLIDNPLAADADFVATTCLADFRPTAEYQQAGIILYDDDDNYLKWVYQFNWKNKSGECFALVNEQGGERQPQHDHVDADPELAKVWLRFTKKGNRYDYATSIDGERFVSHGMTEWGKGGPKRLGLIAKNGGAAEVAKLEAKFEFFELKSP